MTAASRSRPDVGTEPVGEGPLPGPGEPARFVARSAAGLVGTLAAGLVFAFTLALVAASWSPLQSFDTGVVASVNVVVASTPWLVTVLGAATGLGAAAVLWSLLFVAAVWLLVRRSPRLAIYVAVTGLGSAVLSNGLKALVERARPVVDVPIASAPGASFPSGHALGATVTYGVLLLVFLPVVPPRLRKAVIAATAAVVVAVGLTRVALAVHYPSDVVGGWSLGVAWLAVTATAFRRWRAEEGRPS